MASCSVARHCYFGGLIGFLVAALSSAQCKTDRNCLAPAFLHCSTILSATWLGVPEMNSSSLTVGWKKNRGHFKLDEIADVCIRFDLPSHTKPECIRVATFNRLASETGASKSTEHPLCGRAVPAPQGAKNGARNGTQHWRNGSSKPRAVRDVRTFDGLIDLHEKIDLGLSTVAIGYTDA
jgi:hypothetical protein